MKITHTCVFSMHIDLTLLTSLGLNFGDELEKKRENNAGIGYWHECEPVSRVLITLSRDAI